MLMFQDAGTAPQPRDGRHAAPSLSNTRILPVSADDDDHGLSAAAGVCNAALIGLAAWIAIFVMTTILRLVF